jgi:AcrR family transcriptional regulator
MNTTSDKRKPGRAPGRANPRRPAGDPEKRQDLLDIAVRVIAEHGLQACTFRTLAREAGASTMTYTYEFGNRASLLVAILDRCREVMWRERDLDEDDSEDPLDRLRRSAAKGCQLEEETNPFLRTYDLFVIDAPHDEVIASALQETDEGFLKRYIQLVQPCQERGQIPAGIHPEDLVFQIWSLGDGLNLQRYAHPDRFDSERMTRLFTEGFESLVSGHPA